jgi:predicted nucleic acid-binding protein
VITIDASVFVAAVDADEPTRQMARRLLSAVTASEAPIHQPTLTLVEVTAALARRSADTSVAMQAGAALVAMPGLVLHHLDLDAATDAAAVAVAARLRGADATYVAIAVRTGSTLVTLDVELLERAATLVPVATPEAWLAGAA